MNTFRSTILASLTLLIVLMGIGAAGIGAAGAKPAAAAADAQNASGTTSQAEWLDGAASHDHGNSKDHEGSHGRTDLQD